MQKKNNTFDYHQTITTTTPVLVTQSDLSEITFARLFVLTLDVNITH